MTNSTIERTSPSTQPKTALSGSLLGALYRYHGFRVFDHSGDLVGIIDWIWANDLTGGGDYIGLQLQWLRGKARAVPTTRARVDDKLRIVQLPFTKDQLSRAPRFRIDRPLSSRNRAAIAAHFTRSTGETRSSRPAPLAA